MGTASELISQWFGDEPAAPVMQWLVEGAEIAPAPVVHQLWQERLIERVFDDLYITIDSELTETMRALCAAKLLPRNAVVSHLSAVWVHCGGKSPQFAEGILPPNTFDSTAYETTVIRRISIAETDIRPVGKIPVTTPERTVVDLARWSSSEQAHYGITRLMESGVEILPLLKNLTSNVRYGRRAIARLARLNSLQHSLDSP